jgi:hypothetical protein
MSRPVALHPFPSHRGRMLSDVYRVVESWRYAIEADP